MGFYDIKTVIVAFACFYESLKTLKLNKLWMIPFSDEPQPSSTTSQQFLCNQKKLFHLIFEEHTAKKQRGPPVGSMPPCTAGTHTVHGRVTRIRGHVPDKESTNGGISNSPVSRRIWCLRSDLGRNATLKDAIKAMRVKSKPTSSSFEK